MSSRFLTFRRTFCLAFAALLPAAQAAPNDGLVGPYVRVEVGRSSISLGRVAAGATDEGGLAGKLFYGYRFNEHLGVELGYAKFSNFSRRVRIEPDAGPHAEQGRARSAFAVGTGRVALGENWAMLARAGLSSGRVRVGDAAAGKTSLLLGLGLEFRPRPSLSFTLNYDHYGELADQVKARSLLFGFHFTL